MDELVIGGEELPAWTLQADVVDGERVRDRAPPGSAPELVASWHNPTASPVRVPAAPWALVRAYVHHTGPNERARGYGYGGGVAVVQADALVWVEVPPGGDVVRTTPWAALVDAQAWSPGRWTLDLVGGDRVAGLAPDQAVPALRGGVELVVRGDSAPAGDLDVALVFRRGGWAMRVHNPGAVDV
ncbi:MAG TPA: hypothetical protein PKA64_14345, partial [Myxococcota bacterium]|nr:hypothetical protein [Myxococcota bacterium]